MQIAGSKSFFLMRSHDAMGRVGSGMKDDIHVKRGGGGIIANLGNVEGLQ